MNASGNIRSTIRQFILKVPLLSQVREFYWTVNRNNKLLEVIAASLQSPAAHQISYTRKNKAKRSDLLGVATSLLGRQATTVVDVGARWGAQQAWWRLHPLASLVGFEPDPQECQRLNQLVQERGAEQYVPAAVGKMNGKATLHIAAEPACSSLYPPDMTVYKRYPQCQEIRETSTAEVTLKTLDTWWAEARKPHVSFVKLDTQGSELDILRGAEELLAECLGLEVEVEFSPMYTGQPLFHEVDKFLRDRGFSIWYLRSLCHYAENPAGRTGEPDQIHFDGIWHPMPTGSGRLFWGNAVYFRDYVAISDEKRLLILAALLEAAGDRDGAAACLKNLSSMDVKRLIVQLEERS
jgi:FkbM family methyltransferase